MVNADQPVGIAAQAACGPVQADQQACGVHRNQGVFDAARRLYRHVLELGPLNGIDAGQVEHADAAPVRPKQGRASAAVVRIDVKKVLAPV